MGDGQKIIDGLQLAVLHAKLCTPEMRKRVAGAICMVADKDGGLPLVGACGELCSLCLGEADAALAEVAAALSTPDAKE